MKKGIFLFLILIITTLFLAISCKPINIFSPLVNPSKMGNDAKLDAGYNALSSGDYDGAIDYFTSVINNSSGDEKSDAYLGRASAYLHSSAPNLDNVVTDLINGDVTANDTGDIIDQVVSDGDYDDFFDSTQNAADDYNSAVGESTSSIDSGVSLEAYQSNMMAATGIGAQAIANSYNNGNNNFADIWQVTETIPVATVSGYGTVTYNMELDAIITGDRLSTEDLYHRYNISTWTDQTASNNGLNQIVKGDATAKASMMSYLTEAYNSLELLKSDPPVGMTETSITDMQNNILKWTYYGLADISLGMPT